MSVYQYQVVYQGKRSKGYITADTAAEGRNILRKRGMQIVRFKSALPSADKSCLWSLACFSRRRSYQAINEFTHYLTLLLRSGVPLSDAFRVIIRQVSKQIEPVLRRLAERVNEGAELAQAMAQEERYFDSTYIGIVRVGQASGRLEECLERLVQLRSQRQQLRQRIRAALAYPAMVVVVGICVVVFLMTFVVPRITWVLEQSGRSLPLPTRILLCISDGILGYWWVGLGVVLAGIIVVRVTNCGRRIKELLNRQVLKTPILGPLIMKADIAQAAVMLDAMLRSGLPLDEALTITQKSIANVLLEDEFGRMAEALKSGRALLSGSGHDSVLPPVVAHMLTVGEQTGQLEETLQELARTYDSEVEVACRQAVSMLEPMLIIIMGCMIGFIVMSTILPILQISQSL